MNRSPIVRCIDKYPTVARQGTTLRVFWSTYNEADQRWQLNVRTRANDQWSPVTPFSALAPFATNNIQRRQPWAVTENAGMLWLFWLELVGQQWQLRYNRYDGTNWAFPVAPATFPLDAGADPRVEGPPFVVFHPSDTAQRLWVFWARTEPSGASGQRRWRIVYRVKASLNPATGTGARSGPAARAGRVTGSRAGCPGQAEWRCRTLLERESQRQLVHWRATVNRATQVWGPAEMVITSPYTQRDPLPIPIATGTMLVYRANDSVRYTSTVYGATETVDDRYAGSTTLDVGNTVKRALWGTFGDFQTFTSDVGQNGERTNMDQYARETVGLYLAADTTDQIVIQRNQNLLRNALREFLPAQVRAVCRIEPA